MALRFSSSAAAPGSITHCSTGSGGTAAPPPAPPPGIAVTGNRRRIQRARGAGRDAPTAPGTVSRGGRRRTPEPQLMIDAAAARVSRRGAAAAGRARGRSPGEPPRRCPAELSPGRGPRTALGGPLSAGAPPGAAGRAGTAARGHASRRARGSAASSSRCAERAAGAAPPSLPARLPRWHCRARLIGCGGAGDKGGAEGATKRR